MSAETKNLFNDAPVTTPEEDAFGIASFAEALAIAFREMKNPVGATIGLNGPWGSGKTSAVNLIRHYLKVDEKEGRIRVVEFRPWWFRGEEALTLAFLQELRGALQASLGDKAKKLFGKLGRKLLQAGPIVGPAVNLASAGLLGGIAGGATEMASKLLADGDSLEKVMDELRKALEASKTRYLVVVDDIDRLTPEEALQVFKLVKSVGRLPNVMYLTVFDRQLAEAAVQARYPSEGPHFLEKIIQASFELPLPLPDDLYNAALHNVESVCGVPGEDEIQRFWNVFYSCVAPHLGLPRHVARLGNAMSVTWPAVRGEVSITDYVALEAIRLSEPKLYAGIRRAKGRLVGVSSGFANNAKGEADALTKELAALASEQFKANAEEALQRLFPRLEGIGYGDGMPQTWDAERRVCVERHFDTYFRLALGDDVAPAAEVEDFVKHAADDGYVRRKLAEAANSLRKRGQSYLPLWLDELTTHAHQVASGDVQPLLVTLFSIADDLDLDRDLDRSSGFGVGNQLRLHWLMRRLLNGRPLAERSAIYMSAARGAQLGWLADFYSSAYRDYHPREGAEREREEECLVAEDALPELANRLVFALVSAAADGTLLAHKRLGYLLFQWFEFGGDEGKAVRDWVSRAISRNHDLAVLAKAFTSESYWRSMGVVGLGDRVAKKVPRAAIDGLEKLLDLTEFRARIDALALAGSDLTAEEKAWVIAFRNAWVARERRAD